MKMHCPEYFACFFFISAVGPRPGKRPSIFNNISYVFSSSSRSRQTMGRLLTWRVWTMGMVHAVFDAKRVVGWSFVKTASK